MNRSVTRVRSAVVTLFLLLAWAGTGPAQEKSKPGKAAKTPEEAVQLVVEACRNNDLAGVLEQTPEPIRSLYFRKMERMRETHGALAALIQAINQKMKPEDADLAATALGETMFYLDLDVRGKIWTGPIEGARVEKKECEGATCRLDVIQIRKTTEIESQTAIPPGGGEAKTRTEERSVSRETKLRVIAIREADKWKVYPLESWESFKKEEAAALNFEASLEQSLVRLKAVAERLTPEVTAGKYRNWKEIQAVIEAATAPSNPPSR